MEPERRYNLRLRGNQPTESEPPRSSKRPRNVDVQQGPPSSPPKRPRDDEPQEPALKSRVIPAADLSATEFSLPDDKKDAYRALKEYHKEKSDLAQDNTRNAATRKRAIDRLPLIVAAMAALYGPWDPKEWQYMEPKFASGLSYVVDNFACAIMKLVPAWKALRLHSENTSTERRDDDTIKAQKRVRSWYNGLCILTGVSTTQACHIVASSIERDDKSPFWSSLNKPSSSQ